MKTHKLKTWPEYFEKVASQEKTFEVRKNDRDFQEGDFLELHEYDPKTDTYTDRNCIRQAGYILRGPDWGLPTDMVVISLINRQ